MHRRKMQRTKMIAPDYIGGPASQWGVHLDTLHVANCVHQGSYSTLPVSVKPVLNFRFRSRNKSCIYRFIYDTGNTTYIYIYIYIYIYMYIQGDQKVSVDWTITIHHQVHRDFSINLYIYIFKTLNLQQYSKLYVFFWVIPRHLNFICRRFGTLCVFHLHRQVGK
jgi:hypothetical protein